MKKYLALALTIIIFCAGSYFAQRQFLSYENSKAPLSRKSALASSADNVSAVKDATIPHSSPKPSTEPAALPGINFTLSVNGQSYHGSVQEGAAILDAMNALAATTDFRFTSKNFPGMGAFVDSINGKQAAEGYNWIFYTNGIKAQQGISSALVHAGDSIEWKYER